MVVARRIVLVLAFIAFLAALVWALAWALPMTGAPA